MPLAAFRSKENRIQSSGCSVEEKKIQSVNQSGWTIRDEAGDKAPVVIFVDPGD
jgi:hypothetical protein